MANINLRPEPVNVINVVVGSDVKFIAKFTGDDLSGDTYEPTVETSSDTKFIGTATISGDEVTISFSDEQTTEIGLGKHEWKLWRTRASLKSVPIGGVFEVID